MSNDRNIHQWYKIYYHNKATGFDGFWDIFASSTEGAAEKFNEIIKRNSIIKEYLVENSITGERTIVSAFDYINSCGIEWDSVRVIKKDRPNYDIQIISIEYKYILNNGASNE